MFSFDPEIAKELAERIVDLKPDDILRKVLFNTQDHLVQVSKNYFEIMQENKALERQVGDKNKRIEDLTEELAELKHALQMETMYKSRLEHQVQEQAQKIKTARANATQAKKAKKQKR